MKRKPCAVIVVCPHTGDRLCRDMKWRSHADTGCRPGCVMTWKGEWWAMKAARRYVHPRNTTSERMVVFLYEGDTLDAAGHIVRHEDTNEFILPVSQKMYAGR